jgi:prolyl-tRNA editing enzyme YbaK/EbsC (Cys-tRNA(Pro) deacylase)
LPVARTLATVDWPEPVERVAATLRAAAVDARLEEFAKGTPTAEDAAEAVGADLSQIVKSLVFVVDGVFALVLVPGDRRADGTKIAAVFGAAEARIATPDEVAAATGFRPGAVAPFPAPNVSRVLLDRSLLAHEEVWVGAGSPRHLAGLAPLDLVRIASATPVDVAR